MKDHVDQVESEYKGHTFAVPLRYRRCGKCRSEFAGVDEGRANKRAVMAFRETVDEK